MGTLRTLVASVAMAWAMPARADRVADWRPYTNEAAARFMIPTDWIESVMRLESGGLTRLNGRPITSPKGAMGLMQLMPSTWARLRETYRLGADPYDPHDNIIAGAAYLRAMYDQFGYPGLFAAYNAGPGRYAAYLNGGSIPGETQRYVSALRLAPTPALSPATRPSIFVPRANQAAVQASPPRDPMPTLFVIFHADAPRSP